MREPILVTGATGLVGANLVHALRAEGADVRILGRDQDRLRRISRRDNIRHATVGDIRDSDARHEILRGVRTVFHCAHSHEYWRSNRSVYSVNVDATLQLAEEFWKRQTHGLFVFTSSNSTLRTGSAPPVARRDIASVSPRELNSLTKQDAESALRRIAVARGRQLRIIHPSYIIGPWDLRPTPLRLLIPMAMAIPVPVAPPGRCNVVGVHRVVAEHLDAARTPGGVLDRRVTGENIALREYVAHANALAGRSVRVRHLPRRLLQQFAIGRVCDAWATRRICTDLSTEEHEGVSPAEPVVTSMRETAEWFREANVFPDTTALLRWATRFI